MARKITLSDVTKKHIRIVLWLLGSWVVALGLVYITKKPELAGLAPILNYVGYAFELELKKEGYVKAIRG